MRRIACMLLEVAQDPWVVLAVLVAAICLANALH